MAIKVWRANHVGFLIALRSDSLGALSILAKGSSKNANISLVASELALEQAEFSVGLESLTHIPGISNTIPDALSRLWAPCARSIPSSLEGVPRTAAPARDRMFWRIWQF